jgi:type IV pilus assembly protein PilY1
MNRRPFFAWLVAGQLLLWFSGPAVSAPADISNVPPSTMTSSSVRPNLMFILDDSGSMADDFIPDAVEANRGRLCFAYSGYNSIFFNPAITYTPPSDYLGASLGNANFTAVFSNGFNQSGTPIDLSNNSNLNTGTITLSSTTGVPVVTGPTVCGRRGDAACSTNSTTTSSVVSVIAGVTTTDTTTTTRARGNAPGFTCSTTVNNSCTITATSTTTTVQTSKPYWATLNASASNNCVDSSYTAVYDSSSLSAEQRQNYANWYQYYRNRMLTMRSASGQVFNNIDPTRFRVGFSTIHNTGTTDATEFLNVGDFDSGTGTGSQKARFFSRLYGQTPSGSTPLRPALERAGKYFAKKMTNQATDPVQYSCQRNYTLLSTDGYWNTGDEPTSYRPTRLDAPTTALGNVDGNLTTAPRPKYDGTGAENSLADIAKYYYDTDIRTSALNNCSGSVSGQDVCANRSPRPGDTAPLHQNMTTFTLGLGVSGYMTYQSDYDTATSGDFYSVKTGATASSTVCTWQSANTTCTWPNPLSSSASGGLANTGNTVTARIDDVWHAAINGGGQYYSARNPSELVIGLTDALQRIDSIDGSSSSASTSTLRPVPGDDWVFIPSYETVTWVGDVGAYHFSIDAVTGQIGVSNTPVWKAGARLAAQATRNIYFFDSGAANRLSTFAYTNLPTAQRAYFDDLCLSGAYRLSQCSTLSTTARARVTGDNVVNYLKGSRTYELSQSAVDDRVFRSRLDNDGVWNPLGDVINASPAYVRKPPFAYEDAGYSSFRASNDTRTAVLYVAANDGMVHAFRASDGQELWAFIPTQVMSNMYKLADRAYANAHSFFVDGSPVVGDVYDGTRWRTILVGGFGGGGRGYYALDVTDPAAPAALWEYTDADMGLSYGEPVITKNKNGRWIVALTSGYNNTSGDGNGHLYVLDAITGVPTQPRINTYTSGTTPAGTATTPSNLGKINAYVEREGDNTAERIYGADMLGNVWRFDFDDNVAPAGSEATLLGVAQSPSGAVQPITTLPLLYRTTGGPVVSVGTGRYLGSSDLGDTTVNSLYAFKDTLATTGAGILRNNSGMVRQTMDDTHQIVSPATVDWATNLGWYIDFDVQRTDPTTGSRVNTGERVNVDMDIQLDVITVATTVPTPTPCSPGGTSWLYYFDARQGAILRVNESATPIVGIATLMEGSNTSSPRTITLTTNSDRSIQRYERPPDPSGGGSAGAVRRTSWRELVD